ncbi:MerR family transcriptional regulator [Nocardioides limicola]|uniref:MerR family transcriptional regulator n=1 Tax=Nocardioides limicola TaxID=2803368 RepID=UPI00193AF6DE|nr:MerR family transcriptional regulator [Nocardioides sp. DJM-14]
MTGFEPLSTQGLYGISVAAELVGTGPQNLRAYERRGLVEPDRTTGGTRLYSDADVARLRRITELIAAGLNLTGVEMVLALEADNARLRATLSRPLRRAGEPPPAPR